MNWETKHTGKGLNLIIFIVFSLIGLIFFVLHGSRNEPNRDIKNLAFTFLIFSPLLLLWILGFVKFIYKKKIPIRIESLENGFVFHFNKIKNLTLHINDFSYTFHSYNRYNVLVINKRLTSKKGHIIDKEYFSIVVMDFGTGWKKEIIQEIASFLEKAGVHYYNKQDKSFLLRIIE